MTLFVPAALILRFAGPSKAAGQRRVVELTRLLCVALMKILNLRCEIDDAWGLIGSEGKPMLVLPNHASYVDVIIVNALFHSVFVTSREIEETPILGWITRAAGCAFVERRNVFSVQKDIVQLADLLNQGHSVTLFPEGSTSNGEYLMEFKKTLLESAVRSRCRVVPVCIRYERPHEIAWYGEMTFFPHLWSLMRTSGSKVRVSVLGEVPFRGHKSRKRIAREVSARIAERFHNETPIARAVGTPGTR